MSGAEPNPRRSPNLTPRESVPADAADHAEQFRAHGTIGLSHSAGSALAQLGIPDHQIGAFDHDFGFRLAAFHPKDAHGWWQLPWGADQLEQRRV